MLQKSRKWTSCSPKHYFSLVGQVTVTWHSSDGRADDNCWNELYSPRTSRHLVLDNVTSAEAMLLVRRTSASQISLQPLFMFAVRPIWDTALNFPQHTHLSLFFSNRHLQICNSNHRSATELTPAMEQQSKLQMIMIEIARSCSLWKSNARNSKPFWHAIPHVSFCWPSAGQHIGDSNHCGVCNVLAWLLLIPKWCLHRPTHRILSSQLGPLGVYCWPLSRPLAHCHA